MIMMNNDDVRYRSNTFSNSLSFICISTIAWLYIQYNDVLPYMDEIFHVPQAAAYCDGKFSQWDDKITTLPGLYYISYIISRIYNFLNHWLLLVDHKEGQDFCSHQYLRVHNVMFAAIAFFVYNICYDHLHKFELMKKYTVDRRHIQRLIAITLLLYPLNFFYYFLYYTDTMSNIVLILTYSQALQWKLRSSLFSKLMLLLLASLSILLRQTNSIWLLFIAGTNMLQYLESERLFDDSDASLLNFVKFTKLLVLQLMSLLSLSWPLLVPVGVFVYFVYSSGSVVMGDKDNHQITLHPAMPLHMLGTTITFLLIDILIFLKLVTCAVFLSPSILSDLYASLKSLKDKKIKDIMQFPHTIKMAGIVLAHLLGILATSSMVVYGSKSHPFLLADNRHYTFYLWRWLLSKPIVRVIISPLYYYLIVRVISRLRQRRGPVWIAIYLVATYITLLPASLLEPRYFTPGVMIFALNGSLRLSSSLYMIIGLFVIINAIIISIFLESTFTWPDGSIARFMP